MGRHLQQKMSEAIVSWKLDVDMIFRSINSSSGTP